MEMEPNTGELWVGLCFSPAGASAAKFDMPQRPPESWHWQQPTLTQLLLSHRQCPRRQQPYRLSMRLKALTSLSKLSAFSYPLPSSDGNFTFSFLFLLFVSQEISAKVQLILLFQTLLRFRLFFLPSTKFLCKIKFTLSFNGRNSKGSVSTA